MDLVDLIAEKRFIGQEFLTWLWFKSDQRGGSIELPGKGDIIVVFEKHMLLEYGEGESNEKCICSGLQTELQEARTGLKMGKKLEQARIQLVLGDYEYNFTLAGAMMEYRSVKLPKTAGTEQEERDNPEAIEGMILERIFLFDELVRTVNELFRMFLTIRVSEAWRDEVSGIRAWIHAPSHLTGEEYNR
jgi:recombination associated protein RdgC